MCPKIISLPVKLFIVLIFLSQDIAPFVSLCWVRLHILLLQIMWEQKCSETGASVDYLNFVRPTSYVKVPMVWEPTQNHTKSTSHMIIN